MAPRATPVAQRARFHEVVRDFSSLRENRRPQRPARPESPAPPSGRARPGRWRRPPDSGSAHGRRAPGPAVPNLGHRHAAVGGVASPCRLALVVASGPVAGESGRVGAAHPDRLLGPAERMPEPRFPGVARGSAAPATAARRCGARRRASARGRPGPAPAPGRAQHGHRHECGQAWPCGRDRPAAPPAHGVGRQGQREGGHH